MQKPKQTLLIILIASILLTFGITGIYFYHTYLAPNANTNNSKSLYIANDATFDMVMDSIQRHQIVRNKRTFLKVAHKKNYPKRIHSGHYTITKGMSNRQIINMLCFGWQTPVRLVFNSVRLPEDLAAKLAPQIELDSATIADALLNDSIAISYGFKRETFISMFVPNTYQVYWNTSAKSLLDRMKTEYDHFWNTARLAKAAKLGLTKVEVSILASIVMEETLAAHELPVMARVYLNRLNRHMPLQACPTVKFAMRQFDLHRILKQHVEFDSPYNTYQHLGFPPGPIRTPSIKAIDAVLNAPNNNYLYFCAKPDFSGTHNFSSTLTQHNRYAREYQRVLSKQGIYR